MTARANAQRAEAQADRGTVRALTTFTVISVLTVFGPSELAGCCTNDQKNYHEGKMLRMYVPEVTPSAPQVYSLAYLVVVTRKGGTATYIWKCDKDASFHISISKRKQNWAAMFSEWKHPFLRR